MPKKWDKAKADGSNPSMLFGFDSLIMIVYDKMTTIHNKRKESYDVYIGRPTIFGNPFEIGKDDTRDEVVEKYRVYFEKRIQNDDNFLLAVASLKNKRL